MNKKQAADQISTLFQSTFQRDNYTHFLRNLLNDVEARDNHYSGNTVPDAFKQHVNQYWRIGKYTDPEEAEMDLYVVEVKSLSKLDRARTALRNFSVRTMQTFGYKDHALIAFYAKEDGGADWRFSYVKIEHGAKLDEKSGKVKLVKELTPAKRYSFLVGEHENSHTAQAQLVDLLAMDYANPTIDEIEKSFSIEKVTKEFFEQYKDLFVRLSEVLEEQPYFRQELDEKKRKQHVAKFSKKLLGQIVFLYFLQKKGWMGVKDGEAWGKGDRKFLRTLFKSATDTGGNYYAEKLQLLFYEALADDRKDQFDPSYYKEFDCKIPFLNGGLFEADYDWQKIRVEIPDTIFSNTDKTKAGDPGTGILDVFDRYNFTIKEDEPLEKEVAIDPEMLGKVFENMLEITERKSKGAFYTPREIVHYMCQESLIHYLDGEVGDATKSAIPKADIETLVRKGIFAIENDQRILDKGKETDAYTFKLPESIRIHAELIDDKLADIKICDPAIGSGAFPVGMLHEIIHARQALAPHLPEVKRLRPYDLKKHTIAHSIYGVDIDPSAIDIARLRLWLSLVVDEDDYTSIDALPNLDYKIMQGNSLIEEYEGVTLFDEAFIQDEDDSLEREKAGLKQRQTTAQTKFFSARNAEDKALEAQYEIELNELLKAIKKIETKEKTLAKEKASQSAGLFDLIGEARKKAQQLEGLHQEFFEVSSPAQKRQLRDQITTIEWELIEATLAEQNKTDALAKLTEYKNSGEKPWFLWKLNFSEVFKQKGGFDIVIGNPPYGVKFTRIEKEVLSRCWPNASKIPDSYAFFILLGISTAKDNGVMNYIVPNTFCDLENGDEFRKYLLESVSFNQIWQSGWAFESAVVDTLVVSLCRRVPSENHRIHISTTQQYEREQGSYLEVPLNKIDFRTPKHILNLHNRVLINSKPLSESFCVKAGVKLYEKGKGNPPQTPAITKEKPYSTKDEDPRGWEPLYRGKDIAPYILKDSGERVNYGPWLAAPRSPDLFEPPKILMRRTDDRLRSSLDLSNSICVNSCHVIKLLNGSSELASYYNTVAILNSEASQWIFEVENPQMVGKTFAEIKVVYVERLLLPKVNSRYDYPFFFLVNALIILGACDEKSLIFTYIKQLVDGLVYELYFPDEIKAAGKEILPHLGELTPLTDEMSQEEKRAVIQQEFERLYDPSHPVRNHLETLDSVEEVRIIREALKR